MELSAEVLDGLQLAADSTHIPDQRFEGVIQNIVQSLLEPSKRDVIAECGNIPTDKTVLKQAVAAISTLILEAAKHDTDEAALSPVLEDCKFTPERIASFNKIFKEQKQIVRAMLSGTGSSHPEVVDLAWRLDNKIKSSDIDKVSEPTFLLTLKTEHPGIEGTEDIQFTCSQEELQDLSTKLREACKSLERAGQM